MASAVICLCDLWGPINALLSIVSSTSACTLDPLISHGNRKLKEILLSLVQVERSPLSRLLIDSKNPWNPLQMCYCSGSGTCNRSGMCFSVCLFSLDLHYLSVCSCNSSVCLPSPSTALNYWRRCQVSWDRGVVVLLSISCSRECLFYCRILWPKWNHGWLYQILCLNIITY